MGKLLPFSIKFVGLKMQKSIFYKKKNVFSVVFIKLKIRWLQIGRPDLETPNNRNFA